ncbi:MAG: T9SS type A sorting domain-containing protein [Chitinophagaceae bacterium]|nr:T9SS type A sorting domain-containing protein [Chitinophagaceae bacterium]
MKKIILAIFLLMEVIAFAQNVTINYETWNPSSPPCNIFGSSTNVPATGTTSGTIAHRTRIGQPSYAATDLGILMPTEFVTTGSVFKGTSFIIDYNFKANYTYTITINAAANSNASLNPYIRIDRNNNGGSGGNGCNGADNINASGGGNPAAAQVNSTTFTNYSFGPFVQGSNQPSLEISAFPASSGGFKTVVIRKITIIETPPAPVFTLSPNSSTIECGTSVTRNFAATNVYNSPGTLSYDWNLGSSNNGWIYLGNAAPQTFTTTSPNISLTSSSSASNISNVSVTVKLNGANYSTLNSTTAVTNSLPNFSLSNITFGLDCNNMNVKADLPLTSTITWTTTNGLLINGNTSPYTTTYGNTVDVYSPSGLSGSVAAQIGSGNCAKQANNTVAYCPCLPWSNPNPSIIYAPNFRSEPLIAQVDEHPDGAWSYQWYIDGQLVGETSTGYLWTNTWPCMGNPRNLEVVAVTYCGRSVPINVGEIFLECWGYRQQSSVKNDIKLFPNPATNTIFVSLSDEEKHIKASSKLNNISQITVFDNLGIIKLRKVFGKNAKQVELDISKLNTGMYFIEVFDGKIRQRKQFIKK